MSDLVVVALISCVPSTIAAIVSILNNLIGREHSKDIAAIKDNVVTLEKNTNSMKDALVKVTGESEFAKGLKEGEGNVSNR